MAKREPKITVLMHMQLKNADSIGRIGGDRGVSKALVARGLAYIDAEDNFRITRAGENAVLHASLDPTKQPSGMPDEAFTQYLRYRGT